MFTGLVIKQGALYGVVVLTFIVDGLPAPASDGLEETEDLSPKNNKVTALTNGKYIFDHLKVLGLSAVSS